KIILLVKSYFQYTLFAFFIYRSSNMYHMNKFNDDKCCDMRGLFGFLTLFLLSKKSMHGQEIAKRKGEKPSPGTIYPAFKSLRDSGFLEGQKEGKTIIYNLTRKGKKTLELAKGKFSRTFLGVLES
ncbi:MAG TPA: PadR family transcriptional regulator, partial [Nitrososphaeraceae archaeon]|nr:PadR family transcriptional regulator [Nitrososphaeraceae archaeon]